MPRPKLFADETTTITVAEMRDGDFLVTVPAQKNLRGLRVNSGVTALEADHTWGHRSAPRRRAVPTEARRWRTLSGAELSLPADAIVTVRRKLAAA